MLLFVSAPLASAVRSRSEMDSPSSNQAMERTANRLYAQMSPLMNATRVSRGGSSLSR
jgi:hypothetical protein